MEMNFCRRCGAPLTKMNVRQFTCANNHVLFANSTPTAGAFIVDDQLNVTLSVRGIEPHTGMLDAFGGFVEHEETLEYALERELLEELQLEPSQYTAPVFICSSIGHYPFGGEVETVLSSLFYFQLHPGATLTPSDDVAGIKTFPLLEIPLDELHDDDIRQGILKLQQLLS